MGLLAVFLNITPRLLRRHTPGWCNVLSVVRSFSFSFLSLRKGLFRLRGFISNFSSTCCTSFCHSANCADASALPVAWSFTCKELDKWPGSVAGILICTKRLWIKACNTIEFEAPIPMLTLSIYELTWGIPGRGTNKCPGPNQSFLACCPRTVVINIINS